MPAVSPSASPRRSACFAATRSSSEVKALDQSARAQLRAYGVRFGAFNIYMPALLKPAAADLLLLLWALHAGRNYGLDADALPPRPQQGLTSVEADASIPEPYWHAAGFQVAGTRAVRIDMLERLSDLIRARVSWRQVEGGAAAPSGATGDGGFRVAPELMSVVGCSGEDFASILKALGFRRERRKLRGDRGRPRSRQRKRPMARGGGRDRGAGCRQPGLRRDLAPRQAQGSRGNHDARRRRQAAAARAASASAAPARAEATARAEGAPRARQTLRLSPCSPSFAATWPPAVPEGN